MVALKPQNKQELAHEMAVLKFSKAQELLERLVDIELRIRPFFEKEKLVFERRKASYLSTSNLISVKGKKSKFEVIKFRKIFSE